MERLKKKRPVKPNIQMNGRDGKGGAAAEGRERQLLSLRRQTRDKQMKKNDQTRQTNKAERELDSELCIEQST
ncbi:unnamed protein product [Leuciscus chuanchicus]